MKIALYTVGPFTNKYAGVHTFSDVLLPFVNELKNRNIDVIWLGIQLENEYTNKKLSELNVNYCSQYALSMSKSISRYPKSWDYVDAFEFDALLIQPRPVTNIIENIILLALVEKFLAAKKKVYCWEVDMLAITNVFTDEMKEKIILLHPAILPTGQFKKEIYFPFFTYSREDADENPERDLDFVFLGNIYFRQAQALQFFSQLNTSNFKKLVFGSWIQDEERRVFSSQFDNFEFAGSCEHWAAIPVMRRAHATLHIAPDIAKVRGLMTARVFSSQMSRCLCFCDAEIYGAELFFPSELIVKDGNEIIDRWDWVQEHREELLLKRDILLKEHTVEKRVEQFIKLLNE